MTDIEIIFPDTPSPETGMPSVRTGWEWLPGILLGVLLLFLGMGTIFVAAIVDMQSVIDRPWNSAFILFDVPDNLPDVESYPVRVRRVSRNEPLKDDAALQMLEALVEWERFEQPLRLTDPELLIALDLPESTQSKLLATGRLPHPGAPEVLAGSLARDDAFWIDDVQFTVVGRLEDSVSGFLFAYLLPHASDFEPMFADDTNTVAGLLVVNGQTLLEAGLLPDNRHGAAPVEMLEIEEISEEDSGVEEAEPEAEGEGEEGEPPLTVPAFTGGMLVAQRFVSLLAMAGLLLAALGGVMAQFCLFKLLWVRRYRPVFAILDEFSKRPWLFAGLHVLMYGVFFTSMYSAVNNPLVTYRISQYIEAVFSHGGLGYIGDAYASGDVTRAAWMTFYNNYIEQTLGLTFLISLFPIPLGLIKNLLSFSLVGSALAPLWVGASQAYVLHSVTMVLELQAYIVACFAITAWPLHLLRGIRQGQFFAHLKSGLLMLFAAAIVSGVMLGIAAFYEAFTLIHLMMP